jgi:hypothetical protein
VFGVRGRHLEPESHHAEVTAFIAIAVHRIPHALGDGSADERDHAETVREHLIGDRGGVLEKRDLVDRCKLALVLCKLDCMGTAGQQDSRTRRRETQRVAIIHWSNHCPRLLASPLLRARSPACSLTSLISTHQ